MIVDSNVVVDLLDGTNAHSAAALASFAALSATRRAVINEIIFAEVASRFSSWMEAEDRMKSLGVAIARLTLEECHRAGVAFRDYRRRGAPRTTILPDFLIGAQAAVRGLPILTRDRKRFASYFPEVELIDTMSESHG